MFPLEIFPERSLAESVITTVWVGIFVVAFFNLRLGWPFSGLVVPGYLVPLMIAKPTAAMVVCLQGAVTYFIVRYFCDRFHSTGVWSSVFGRDRFLALIIASLAVRLVLDGWILPTTGDLINRTFDLQFDYRNNLTSFGLIIVALIANQFWKTGFVRGMLPFWVIVGITYVLVRYGLMEYTNFNIGNLEYMYENISASLVASPKAYIMLLTCAFAASRLNLLYGWDFNGILIPSLLALEWYQPLTIISTFAEAFIILGLAVLVLRLPSLQQTTIEGARKLVLFFNISFLYKLVLGHVQQAFDVPVMLTDLYGYGYLVPTLIAVKMHDKRVPLVITRATMQTSIEGAIIGSLIGLALTLVPHVGTKGLRQYRAETVADAYRDDVSLAEVLREDKVLLYRKRGESRFPVPLPQETDSFMRGLRDIERYVRTRDPESLQLARADLAGAGYEARVVSDRYIYLRESGEVRGWGLFVFDLERKHGTVVEVPAPVDEWAVLEAGSFLFDLFDCRAMAIAGCSRRLSADGAADVLQNGRTLYGIFHRVVGRGDVLQVRGYNEKSLERLFETTIGRRDVEQAELRSILWIQGKIPDGLDLLALRELIGSYHVEWAKTPYTNLQREETRGGFAELVLGRPDRRKLLYSSVITERAGGHVGSVERKNGYLQDFLLERGQSICQRGSNAYVPAKEAELLLFDEEILTPLLEAVRDARARGFLSSEALADLEVLSATAAIFNYAVTLFHDEASGDGFVVLAEREDSGELRCWGTFVFRLALSGPYCVQVPRPGFERSSLSYGVSLFGGLEAGALLLAGSHPRANEDGSADVVRNENRTNLFSLVSQVLIREAGPREFMIVQSRAFGFRESALFPTEDILLGFVDGCTGLHCLSELALSLYERLESDNATLRIVSGDLQTCGYEAYGTPQAQYAMMSDKEFAILWLSPFFRYSYRQESDESYQTVQFEAAGIGSRTADLYRYLEGLGLDGRREPCPAPAVEAVERFVETADIVSLVDLDLSGTFVRLERIVDVNSKRPFLLGYLDDRTYPVVFNLALYQKGDAVFIRSDGLSRKAVNGFIRSLAGRLEILEVK